MKIESWPIEKVKPYDNNPRNNDDAVDATANSIKEFGWQQPIVVDKDGVIIAGHTRLKAAKQLGLKEVPVKIAEGLTDNRVKAYRLADNKTSDLADWNYDQLADELGGVDELDMAEFGFDDKDYETEDLDDDQPGADGKDISDNLKEKFQVIVNCTDEDELQSTFEKLQEEGYDCDILTL